MRMNGLNETVLKSRLKILNENIRILEERVTNRTRDLDRAVEVGHSVTQVSDLDQMLEKVADTYAEEVGVLVSSMISLLEPVMVITLGGIVGYIVVALFMPMIGMLQAMQEQGG